MNVLHFIIKSCENKKSVKKEETSTDNRLHTSSFSFAVFTLKQCAEKKI